MAESVLAPAKLIANVARLRRRPPIMLELDLTEGLAETPPSDPLQALLTHRRTRLPEVLTGLRRGARDPRVLGLIAKVGGQPLGLAMAQELRAGVSAFRKAGKLTIAWAETFGEFGPGNVPYYLATAFEVIGLQPSGDVGLTGISIEQRFLRGALDKLGVDYQVAQRHEYKNAANVFSERGFTEPHRESLARIAESLTEQIVQAVATGRGLAPDRVRELIDRSPLIGDEAIQAGLVDRLAYRDEIYADLRERIGEEAHLQFVGRYARASSVTRRLPKPAEAGVALIYGTGPIRLGRSGRGTAPGGMMGSDSMAAALRAAAKDDKVAAVCLRVNSPGGSYVASDTIWREVVRTRELGKPVVVSMGDMAASGGYFIAVGADRIVAQPGTLTGSIGVFGGKPVLRDLLERFGVTTEAVEEGAHARMFSTARAFSGEEWDRFNAFLDRVYEDFVGKAARGRGMSRDQMHELARGRVWTGADAKDRGLVDELGGLATAARIAREMAGLPSSAPLRLFPRVSPVERLRPAESSEDRAAALARIRLEAFGPLAALAASFGLPAGGPLLLPGSWEIR